jgi:REP element-mobilizing transposase RayT
VARPLRVQFQNACYHVTARGNERREMFRDDADRSLFLLTLGQACGRFGLVTHGYCLMPNHYHLLVQTPRGNLSQAVGWLQATYPDVIWPPMLRSDTFCYVLQNGSRRNINSAVCPTGCPYYLLFTGSSSRGVRRYFWARRKVSMSIDWSNSP